jgi:hypothetical protein
MTRYSFARTALVICVVGFAISVYGQEKDKSTAKPPAKPPTEIIYTGRFLGYARVPSLQEFTVDPEKPRCPPISPANDSEAAVKFLASRNTEAHKNSILLGTGDNFSPELEARVFDNVPTPSPSPKKPTYVVGNKELYFSDGNQWYFYKKVPPSVEKIIHDGLGTIPTDNVGCFLRAAGFNAIVPGKHDFYFGAERVRALARFLTRTQKEDGYKPVQMLGANLVLQTSPITPKPIPPTLKEKPWFTPDWSKDYPVMNLSDGASVYPWFSYVKVQIGKLPNDPDARKALKEEFENTVKELKKTAGRLDKTKLAEVIQTAGRRVSGVEAKQQLTKLLEDAQKFPGKDIHVCPTGGNPNEIPRTINSTTCELLDLNKGEVRLVDNVIAFFFELKPLVTGDPAAAGVTIGAGKPDGDKEHFSTLVTGKNYGLCNDVETKDSKGATTTTTNCLRFAVHTPLFYFPHVLPQQSVSSYTDPDPYVYIDGRAAVFGIVEPGLGSQVGILNFGWKNLGDGLTSKVSVEDPADALRQQLEYFERQHPNFKDLKILLAQTSPQRAKILATRFPEFQIVISAADLEQATSELELSTTWKPDEKAGALVAVPAPYFDAKDRKGVVHFGMIDAEKGDESWKLSTKSLHPDPITVKEDQAKDFWDEVKKLPNCLPSPLPSNIDKEKTSNQDYLKLLVLCTMREQLSADVALIQSRDLFEQIPLLTDPATSSRMLKSRAIIPANLPASARDFQQMLDRLIWKGDLLTLLYVPGDALKKALDMSGTLEAEEKATLSLVVDRGRKLETLGVTKDKITGEYIINELPLDPKKIYAVATTDFIGAGDTGYPDLAAAALNPKTHPAGFPQRLVSISSLVCRKLFPNEADANLYCLNEIVSAKYLDETVAEQIEPYRQPSVFQRFVEGLPFKGPNKNPALNTVGDAVEQRVQRRSIWMLSLKDFSFTFNSLNNNLTDAEVEEKFVGNPTSSVQAKHSRDFRIGLDVKGWRSSHRRDFFIEPKIDYKRQTTGDTPEKTQVSQISNRLSAESGFVLWRKPGRPIPNFGLNLSVQAETQLLRPFSNFTLDNKETLKIYQDRSLTLSPRLGLRWQNKDHFAEFGIQIGKQFDAFRGYEFDTAGGTVQCVVDPLKSIDKCITENSKLADGIRKDSPVRVILEGRPRAGVYWKTNFSVPFGPKVKYTLDEEADFLFVNFSRDTSLDTRFRDISKHSLSFSIFPSVSIGPTLRLLLYQNKVNRDFLFQREFGIETKISFDVFNRRETGVQFRNKPK